MEESQGQEPAQKRLMRNSPMETMPVSNGSEADVSESIVDNANASGLASTTDGEQDPFVDDDIDLSSLGDSDEDYYQKKVGFCLCKTVNKNKMLKKKKQHCLMVQ